MTSDPQRDLMERVRAADPAARAELGPGERAEADALLRRIVAEPRRPRRRLRVSPARWPRMAAAGAALACLTLAALVAVDLVRDDEGSSIADRAYAAVSDDDVIYHYVLDTRASTRALPPDLRRDLELANGRLETWYRSDGSAFHSRQFRRGREGRLHLVLESAQSRGRLVDYNPERNVLGHSPRGAARGRSRPIGPLDEFRRAYRDGKVVERGKTTFLGRPAYRLLMQRGQPGSFRQRMAYYVDQETYLPLGTRERTSLEIFGRRARVRTQSVYKLYERLPDTRANRRLLRMGRHPGARRVEGSAILP